VKHLLQRAAAQVLGYAVALTLFVMMLVTCADVAGRYIFNHPIPGAFELTEMLLAAMIFTALPLVTVRGEHVTVDLFDGVTPDWLLRVQHVIACLIGVVCTGFLAYRLGVRAENMVASGQTTAQLHFTLGWLTWGMAIMMGLTSAALGLLAFRHPRRHSAEDLVL
jgi:TRAP-type C4-dicarboxylate transport system permease small subunit